jgi:hypothetical protein
MYKKFLETKIPWWIKFCLLFKKATYGYDFSIIDNKFTHCKMKQFKGIFYVLEIERSE